ncbi:DUF3576 domain-containing protein, partial [bacterium]
FKEAFNSQSESKQVSNTKNNHLWQASLDVLSFMPMSSVDSSSGIIITDWYTDKKLSNERFKIHVFVKSDKINVESIEVKAFKQILDRKNIWIDDNISSNLSIELENKIIERAKYIRIAKK